MSNVDTFRAAFADYRGALMAQFSQRARHTFAQVVERYGPTARAAVTAALDVLALTHPTEAAALRAAIPEPTC